MIAQPDPNATTQTSQPDPLRQAGELLRQLNSGAAITGRGIERDAATVIAAVTYAATLELRRIGDLLETLCDVARDDTQAQGE